MTFKKRKGFRQIVIDGRELQYCVSLKTNKVIFYSEAEKFEFPLLVLPDANPSWRGKHDAGGYGKRQVASLWRHYNCI